VNAELLEAIERSPDDESGYLVLADWLLERGDPRGELIRLHLRRGSRRRIKVLEKALLPFTPGALRHATWSRGFLHFLRLDLETDEGLPEILAHPSCRLLRDLELRIAGAALDLTPLVGRPGLRSLDVRAPRFVLSSVRPPSLISLRLASEDEPIAGLLRSIGTAPGLTRLALIGSRDTDAIARLLVDMPIAGQLVSLDLAGGELTTAGARHLCAARARFASLARLNLFRNQIDEQGCALLASAFHPVELWLEEQRDQ
jgi:uncharacterized protein (TIGR02996 family)